MLACSFFSMVVVMSNTVYSFHTIYKCHWRARKYTIYFVS